MAAAKYLKTLNKMFDGDWNMVLAAYNGGPGRVQRAINRSGVDDFWDSTATSKFLPRETREYVPMIFAAMIIARNPVSVRITVLETEPIAYDKVNVPTRHRSAPRRRVGRHDRERDPGTQSGTPPLDHAREVSGITR